jgi:prepilin-type N-terminal cleavage/methylation domain-containing protein
MLKRRVTQHAEARRHRSQSGFTLIEMIASLALLGLLAAIFGLGLVAAVESYDFSRSNSQIAQKGQMAMTRMIRELTTLTRVVRIHDDQIIYERMDDNGTSIWGIFFDSSTQQVLLAENIPESTTTAQGDVLVDGVDDWSLQCFIGSESQALPIDANSLLSTMQITLKLDRPDSAERTQDFTTLIHLRNNSNDGGARR